VENISSSPEKGGKKPGKSKTSSKAKSGDAKDQRYKLSPKDEEEIICSIKREKTQKQASAVEVYARKAKLGEEATGYAREIRLRAMAKLGEMLEETERAKGTLKQGPAVPKRDHGGKAPPTLEELGITKKESSEAQALKDIAEQAPEEFEKIASGEKSVSQVKRERQKAEIKVWAMVAARLANLPPHRPENKSASMPTYSYTQPDAAKLLNVSERLIRYAKVIM